jgi:hypothetical protein
MTDTDALLCILSYVFDVLTLRLCGELNSDSTAYIPVIAYDVFGKKNLFWLSQTFV